MKLHENFCEVEKINKEIEKLKIKRDGLIMDACNTITGDYPTYDRLFKQWSEAI